MSLGITISQLVRNDLPTGFVVSDNYITTNTKIQQFMLYIQAGIPEDEIYDESNWPDGWNLLISYLIIYQILQTAILGGILLNTSSQVNGGTSSNGQKKKIVTGPTEVEYQDTAAAFSTLLKNLTTDKSSILNLVIGNACTLSRILGIKIPFCKGLQIGAMFMKAGQCYSYGDFLKIFSYEAMEYGRGAGNQVGIIL